MTKPVRTVLFDAGNTIVHLDYPFIAAVLAEHDCARTPLEIRIAEYAAKASIDRELAPEIDTPESVEGLLWPSDGGARPSYFAVAVHQLGIPVSAAGAVLEALRRHNEEDCLWRVVAADTGAVLTALQERGYTLGVVSNSDGRIEADLHRRGVGHHFETIVDSHVVGVEKPDPAIFAIALERMGACADEALYVGDVFGIDVVGARLAGLDAVLLDTLGRYPGKIDCRRIAKLGDLLDMLPAIDTL
jgi:putative hydrolase of the HAD superfamily